MSGFGPLGAELTVDSTNAAMGVSIGSDGIGSGGRASGGSGAGDEGGPGEAPIGTRPSVPARVGVSFQRVGKVPPVSVEPYGMMPLGAEGEAAPTSGDLSYYQLAGSGDLGGSTGPLQYIQPIQQFVPPPPASQNFCLINGFDPSWGQPPKTYEGVVVQFDPALGAYRFSPHSPGLFEVFAKTKDERLMRWLDNMTERYLQGYMLQPYKPQDGTGRWNVRWIPRRQEVVCP